MKKFIILGLISLSIGLFSCDEFLETESPSEFTTDLVYNSLPYTEFALNGVYARLTQGNMYGARLSLNYSTNSDIEFVGADNTSYNLSGNRGQSNYFANPGESQMNWADLYTMIERANLVIRGIKDSPLMLSDDASAVNTMNRYLGEALTLRTMAYFDLIRHWGDVPFKTEPTQTDLSNVYLPATDRDILYDSLIRDLQVAETYVPWIGEGTGITSERINKGFIKGLVARICLHRGGYSIRNKSGYPTERGSNWEKYYQLANEKCREIISSGKHSLNPSFIDVFKKLNKFEQDEAYKENLFEVALGLGRSGEVGYSIGVRFYTNKKYGYGNNANVVQTNVYYLYMFDSTDVRRNATIAFYKYGDSNGTQKELFASNPLDYNFQKWDQRWMNEAFKTQNMSANNKIGYGINWVMMRYSDVLLMLAETENALHGGPTADAKIALKEVRKRAFASTLQSEKVDTYVDGLGDETAFFDAIVKERALEFGGEGIRKYDLIRWNLLSTKIQEQRDAIAKMINREPPYDKLPNAIYIKYNSDNEVINKEDIYFYSLRDTTGSNKAYTKVDWLFGLSSANKETYKTRVNLFSSGLNSPIPNRHLYPIYSTAISESRDLLSNSYGY